MEFPQYMEQGSKGPAVNLVLVALAVYVAMSNDSGEFSGIEFDGVYGETGVRWMKDFQKINDLEVDGGFGPTTRACMKEKYGFDFEQAAIFTGGTTVFVQTNGEEIEWSPEFAESADSIMT